MDEQNKELMETKMVDDAFAHLLDTYLHSKHRKKIDIITKAFNFARQAHKGVRRRSGEPYIMHPISVAQIACQEIGLGSTSICAALLHDVVEDTDYTIEDIENIFGNKIALIVDGLTKISGGIFGDHASEQAENFKKLLLTMSEDIRVILIKIADRLHNMRTLGSMIPSKQYKIAGETLYIYAPLANRLGLNKIKGELEDLSFKYEHPEEYAKIEDKLAQTRTERDLVFDRFTAPIRAKLDAMGMKYEIKQRIKSPYSIWNKMQNKHVTFEEIYDILAVRIIYESEEKTELTDCFNIYVQISQLYEAHPERVRDWINHPKANGYQALHVTLMSKGGEWIEVQIRSKRMDDIAEQGLAAHWKYKEGGGSEDEDELEKWLKTIKEILDDPQPNAMDFLETIKLNLYASEIFVFTPKGELKTMPQNCTALDFAFSIHTFLGTHCIGAKVNHKLVPISHKLQSGDQVEILTSKSQHVQPSWINFATTAKAKGKITAIIRREQREQQKNGEDILAEFLEKQDLEVSNSSIDKLAELHKLPNREDLLQAIGKGDITLGDNDLSALRNKNTNNSSWKKFLPFIGSNKEKVKKQEPAIVKKEIGEIDKKKPITLNEDTLENSFIIADCCNPIPGDDVLGYIDQHHIIIHKRQCPIAAKLKASYGSRIVAAQWDTHKKLFFPVNITISGIDRIGLLNEVTGILSRELDVNIHKLTIEVNDGIFEGQIQLHVHDVEDVMNIVSNLKKVEGLKTVARTK
ncbi:MAG: bifunctional (p)ppGpp synthetase/guanosine-3',5'-bis(diphosphate) 3'-pyrophosphohydrolase [Bacteroidales bacterium]|nr:bifunctional (p)ppGpp synthetase/guanosine-3',5'-bis(diphosphate) 3'-pyrophosphohydrolase [Candidatus Minthousia equi]MDO4955551.1 RelA/SpoT family protein [Bacteroidales bacterium]